jgi:hypothetical protein
MMIKYGSITYLTQSLILTTCKTLEELALCLYIYLFICFGQY